MKQLGNLKTLIQDLCFCFISVAVIKDSDKKNLGKKGFMQTFSSRLEYTKAGKSKNELGAASYIVSTCMDSCMLNT